MLPSDSVPIESNLSTASFRPSSHHVDDTIVNHVGTISLTKIKLRSPRLVPPPVPPPVNAPPLTPDEWIQDNTVSFEHVENPSSSSPNLSGNGGLHKLDLFHRFDVDLEMALRMINLDSPKTSISMSCSSSQMSLDNSTNDDRITPPSSTDKVNQEGIKDHSCFPFSNSSPTLSNDSISLDHQPTTTSSVEDSRDRTDSNGNRSSLLDKAIRNLAYKHSDLQSESQEIQTLRYALKYMVTRVDILIEGFQKTIKDKQVLKQQLQTMLMSTKVVEPLLPTIDIPSSSTTTTRRRRTNSSSSSSLPRLKDNHHHRSIFSLPTTTTTNKQIHISSLRKSKSTNQLTSLVSSGLHSQRYILPKPKIMIDEKDSRKPQLSVSLSDFLNESRIQEPKIIDSDSIRSSNWLLSTKKNKPTLFSRFLK